jgi:hypothetical protein
LNREIERYQEKIGDKQALFEVTSSAYDTLLAAT